MHLNRPEQRSSPRFSKQHPVAVVLTGSSSKSTRLPAQIIDVSAEGVALRCTYELAVDSHLILDFSPDNYPDPARVTAVVRNRRGDTYGIQFQPRSQQECESLDRIDGLLLASGFRVEYHSPIGQSRRFYGFLGALAAGLVCGGFLGGSLQSTGLGVSIGGFIGLTVSFAAYTV